MSVIGANTPSASFKSIGDSIAGRIVEFADYQEKDFTTQELKFYDDGNPVMGVRITLETVPGDDESRVNLWLHGKQMLTAVRTAVRNSGGRDLAVGADLGLIHNGFQGRAKTFQAAYEPPAD